MEKNENVKDTIQTNIERLELYDKSYPLSISLRRENFVDTKEYTTFVKNCERLVRSSYEYRQWKKYLIDVLGLTDCVITGESVDECTIEVHHHIPSLFTMCKAVTNKFIDNKQEFSSLDVTLEILTLHYTNYVGYCLLLKSMHEKFHNGFLQIPIDLVNGNYKKFLSDYEKYIDKEDMENIQKRLNTNVSNCLWSKDNYKIAI